MNQLTVSDWQCFLWLWLKRRPEFPVFCRRYSDIWTKRLKSVLCRIFRASSTKWLPRKSDANSTKTVRPIHRAHGKVMENALRHQQWKDCARLIWIYLNWSSHAKWHRPSSSPLRSVLFPPAHFCSARVDSARFANISTGPAAGISRYHFGPCLAGVLNEPTTKPKWWHKQRAGNWLGKRFDERQALVLHENQNRHF